MARERGREVGGWDEWAIITGGESVDWEECGEDRVGGSMKFTVKQT